MKNPKCPKCNNFVKISKIESEKWVCKYCNVIFKTDDIEVKGTWYERIIKKLEVKK